jgi:nucleoside-diphosphate-sugar epimerase
MPVQREVVVITGRGGLIGTAVAGRLREQYDVVGFDRPDAQQPPAHTECVDFDVTSDESVREGLRRLRERHGKRIASVIHLAAHCDFSGSPSDKYEAVTVRGTERLLRGLRGFEVEQFVFSSTVLVHAPCEPGEAITEASPVDPKWPYPESALWAENLIRAERGEIPVVMLRLAGVYDDRCHSPPLANQIQRIYEEQFGSHFHPARLDRGQSFVHLDDVVDVFRRVVKRRAQLPPETVLLVGEPDTVPYGELQETLGRLIHGKEWKTYRIPGAVAKVGAWVRDHLPFVPEPVIKPRMIDRAAEHYELDVSRARALLGWEPRHSLRKVLPVMVEELKRSPPAWYKANMLEPPDPDPRPRTAGGAT